MATNTNQDGGTCSSWIVTDTESLTIQAERNDGVLIAKTSGRIDGTNARDFQNAIESAIERNDSAVMLDLAQLSYISSAGLRVILLTARMLQRQDTNFSISSMQDSIREVFEISGFDKIIQIAPR